MNALDESLQQIEEYQKNLRALRLNIEEVELDPISLHYAISLPKELGREYEHNRKQLSKAIRHVESPYKLSTTNLTLGTVSIAAGVGAVAETMGLDYFIMQNLTQMMLVPLWFNKHVVNISESLVETHYQQKIPQLEHNYLSISQELVNWNVQQTHIDIPLRHTTTAKQFTQNIHKLETILEHPYEWIGTSSTYKLKESS